MRAPTQRSTEVNHALTAAAQLQAVSLSAPVRPTWSCRHHARLDIEMIVTMWCGPKPGMTLKRSYACGGQQAMGNGQGTTCDMDRWWTLGLPAWSSPGLCSSRGMRTRWERAEDVRALSKVQAGQAVLPCCWCLHYAPRAAKAAPHCCVSMHRATQRPHSDIYESSPCCLAPHHA